MNNLNIISQKIRSDTKNKIQISNIHIHDDALTGCLIIDVSVNKKGKKTLKIPDSADDILKPLNDFISNELLK